MKINEILKQLKTIQEKRDFPREAIVAAIEKQKEITPFLLKSLDDAYENAQTYYDSGDDSEGFFIFAIYLLAQFREKAAFPKLVRLLTLSEELCSFILGDILTEAMCRALNCTFNGDLSLLKKIAEDEYLDEFQRLAAIDALFLLLRRGVLSKNELMDYVKGFIEESIDGKYSIAGFISVCIAENHLTELLPLIKSLYDNDLIDESIGGDYGDIVDIMFDYSKEQSVKETIDDIEHELSGWGWFKKDTAKRNAVEFDIFGESLKKHGETVGANESCPCGSGKKYKKCCRDADEAAGKTSSSIRENAYESKLLADYPKLTDAVVGGTSFFEFYSEKAIELDIPIYKALHRHFIPTWELPSEKFQTGLKISYLRDAYARFKAICAEENITDFASFDAKYMVHFSAEEWIDDFLRILDEISDTGIFSDNKMVELFNDILDTLNAMSRD